MLQPCRLYSAWYSYLRTIYWRWSESSSKYCHLPRSVGSSIQSLLHVLFFPSLNQLSVSIFTRCQGYLDSSRRYRTHYGPVCEVGDPFTVGDCRHRDRKSGYNNAACTPKVRCCCLLVSFINHLSLNTQLSVSCRSTTHFRWKLPTHVGLGFYMESSRLCSGWLSNFRICSNDE